MNHMPDRQTLLAPPPSDFSLADLRVFVLQDQALPERRRALMASAINTVGRALRRPIETIPAAPVRLRPLLDPVTPAMARLTAGSWSNVRSMLAAALARVTPGFLPQRFDLAPSPTWRPARPGRRCSTASAPIATPCSCSDASAAGRRSWGSSPRRSMTRCSKAIARTSCIAA